MARSRREILERARALLRRAVHAETPEEEARTSALLLARMVAEHELLADDAREPTPEPRARDRAPWQRPAPRARRAREYASPSWAWGRCLPGCDPVRGHDPECYRHGRPPDCRQRGLPCAPDRGHDPRCIHYPGTWF